MKFVIKMNPAALNAKQCNDFLPLVTACAFNGEAAVFNYSTPVSFTLLMTTKARSTTFNLGIQLIELEVRTGYDTLLGFSRPVNKSALPFIHRYTPSHYANNHLPDFFVVR
ncbi:MAG: hypothetical protein IPH78_15100 [Bacteroidetes bacterium]|nr:hypothetical protein [Bacteroidota bacterium]